MRRPLADNIFAWTDSGRSRRCLMAVNGMMTGAISIRRTVLCKFWKAVRRDAVDQWIYIQHWHFGNETQRLQRQNFVNFLKKQKSSLLHNKYLTTMFKFDLLVATNIILMAWRGRVLDIEYPCAGKLYETVHFGSSIKYNG